jgi:hypothetical protein
MILEITLPAEGVHVHAGQVDEAEATVIAGLYSCENVPLKFIFKTDDQEFDEFSLRIEAILPLIKFLQQFTQLLTT